MLEKYAHSGLTQRAFAESEGIGLSTLCKWLRRAREAGECGGGAEVAEGRWVELDAGAMEASALCAGVGRGAVYRIGFWGSGLSLEVGRGFDAGEVRSLVAALKAEAGL